MATGATWNSGYEEAADDNVRRDPEALVAEYLKTKRSDLKDLIILEYGPVVERIARRYAMIESADDLTQVGYIGLLNALSKFDPNAGVRFGTYATHLVTGEIKHYLRDRAATIRQPAWLQEVRHKLRRAANQLQAKNGCLPTNEELAADTGLPLSQIEDILAQQDLSKLISLDASPMDDEDSESDLDRLDSGLIEPESMGLEERLVLEEAIKKLRDLEQEVLVLFHFESLSQTEIAHRLGISCNYVSHILRQSLSKLRRILAEDERQDRLLRAEDAQVDSVVDPGTGVYDAVYFVNRLTEELHRHAGSPTPVSLVMVNFQGLKSMRQYYGQEGIDEFMADAAVLLKDSVRALDIVCRSGEVEFGVILPQTGDVAGVVQNRLETKLGPWLSARLAGVQVRATVGCATAPDDARTVADLIAAANARGWASDQAA
jgi:RNA polymerase sigma-B factor